MYDLLDDAPAREIANAIEGHPLEHEVIVPEIDAGCN